MSSNLFPWPRGWCRAGLILVVGAKLFEPGALGAARPAAPPPPTNAPPAKATFATNLPNGKDPFFPESSRFSQVKTGSTNAAARLVGLPDQLALKGLSISPTKRLALINNVTLAEGEKGPVKINGRPVMIQCLEIRERSVLISSPDSREVKELRLPKEL